MRAIQVEGDKLVWAEVDNLPEPGPGEVQIQVHATAINRADLVQRSGGYPPPPGASPVLGLECSGEVRAVGDGVSRVQIGDAVCALLAGGGYAEVVNVPAGQVLKVPENVSVVEAAAIPEVFATAYLNLYMEAGLAGGEKVLLHAGASGVGTAAIQMLKASQNECFVTAGSADKIQRCEALGAAGGHNRHEGSFEEAVRDWAGDGVDVVLDPVGAAYLRENLSLLRLNGRLVLIGLMGGTRAELDLAVAMMKRLRIIGSTLRARPIGEKAEVMDRLAQDVWPGFADGTIRPIIEAEMSIQQAEEAHALVASDATFGKVVLQIT